MKRAVKVGGVTIGGQSPVSIQSMTSCRTSDLTACESQISALKAAGCEIIRLAVSNDEEISCAKKLIEKFSGTAFVADIQFDYRLAVKCSEIGFHKVRINPGNIGSAAGIRAVAEACKSNNTAIRVGVNGGSLEKELLEKYGATAQALAQSALMNAALLEKYGFCDMVLSAKSSDVKVMIETYRLLDKACDYPLHLGVTESGGVGMGNVKSAIGIGSLLADGIGQTVRVSLTGDPVNEVYAALDILKALHLRPYCEVVSCPTCSRCRYDMSSLAEEITALTRGVEKNLKIAVMGCVVNGPGEARDADLGIAGGLNKAVIFKKGRVVETLPCDEAVVKFKAMVGGLIADLH